MAHHIEPQRHGSITVYTHEHFQGLTLAEARARLESEPHDEPSIIIWHDGRISGANITPGAHTRDLADIIALLLPQTEDTTQ